MDHSCKNLSSGVQPVGVKGRAGGREDVNMYMLKSVDDKSIYEENMTSTRG